MSDFKVLIKKVEIYDHPHADKLEIAKVDGYECIVRKGDFKTGDLAAYIPENALLPEKLLEQMGLQGRLKGKDKNRVRPVKLRKILSQGLLHKIDGAIGEDVTERLGITKYEPPVPESMSGKVFGDAKKILKFDVENIKTYPNVLREGEECIVTEKLHGTFCMLGIFDDELVVASKGLGKNGFLFYTDESNKGNIYVQTALQYKDRLFRLYDIYKEQYGAIYVLGEIYGKSVQDLNYDAPRRFAVFDFYLGKPNKGHFVNYDELEKCVNVEKPHDEQTGANKFDFVPLVFRGKFSMEKIKSLSNGKSLIAPHIREGIVVRPLLERHDDECGRVIFKSVGEDYLLRKNEGATEYE